MVTKEDAFRIILLALALSGIVLSVFWDYVFEEEGASASSGGASVCPFAKTRLAKALSGLPDLEATHDSLPQLSLKFLEQESSCPSCIAIDGVVYDAGSIKDQFPSNELSSVELASLLSSGTRDQQVSEHSRNAAKQLIDRKLKKIGRNGES